MEAITTALTTSFTTMLTDAQAIVVAALPTALTLIGLYFVINKGISFFKKIANKA